MNTHQKTQQKLADIHMLVNYIKEHVAVQPAVDKSDQLDEIGQTTLEIAAVLKEVETKTGSEATALFSSYRETIDNTADVVLQKLSAIKDTVDTTHSSTKDLFAKVEDVYVAYTGMLESSSKQLEIQRENYTNELKHVADNMEALTNITQKLNAKVMTAEDMTTLLAGIDKQLAEVIAQDEKLNAAQEEGTKQLNQRISNIQKTYHSLDETLVSVDESIKEAVGRMNVLLMQMEVLTGERGNK